MGPCLGLLRRRDQFAPQELVNDETTTPPRQAEAIVRFWPEQGDLEATVTITTMAREWDGRPLSPDTLSISSSSSSSSSSPDTLSSSSSSSLDDTMPPPPPSSSPPSSPDFWEESYGPSEVYELHNLSFINMTFVPLPTISEEDETLASPGAVSVTSEDWAGDVTFTIDPCTDGLTEVFGSDGAESLSSIESFETPSVGLARATTVTDLSTVLNDEPLVDA